MTLHPAAGPLKGQVEVPGDKSIGHRSLILGALADGPSTVTGLSAGADVASTRRCLEALGVRFEDLGPGAVRVHGTGLDGLTEPAGPLDAGNSGTTVRLLAGVVAGRGFPVTFTGDASLSRRPMARVATPLRRMGALVEGTDRGGSLTLPLTVTGAGLQAIHYESPVASAQVKSCVLLAGLRAIGRTAVSEPAPSRDHTERMLAAMGAPLTVDGPTVRLEGPVARLAPVDRVVPGDPSSAAFLVAAACLVPGSEVRVENVCLNPTRIAFVDALRKLGADVAVEDAREVGGEPVGTLVARYAGRLRGVDLEGADVAGLIDEVPVLAAVAAAGRGLHALRRGGGAAGQGVRPHRHHLRAARPLRGRHRGAVGRLRGPRARGAAAGARDHPHPRRPPHRPHRGGAGAGGGRAHGARRPGVHGRELPRVPGGAPPPLGLTGEDPGAGARPGRGAHRPGDQEIASNRPAAPWPPPMHIVTIA